MFKFLSFCSEETVLEVKTLRISSYFLLWVGGIETVAIFVTVKLAFLNL